MLDSETKRKIDNARDILVGKLPDPKSQIEQITLALIYKFMGDMDKRSEEMGGKPTFFTGEFEKYSWDNLLSSRLSGLELVNYYNEALLKMNQNKNLPQLFRDIFKNAYLPYRDPETLKNFLREIDWFDYNHSEKLGDAFEYLLLVMGSQGDAGQFRTPRNIINVIVDVVDPKKDDTILDTACGTAGFLISSYKKILEKNKDEDGKINLNPDEKKKLVNNIVGYDLSPDMVRLSLVNMYLHSFPDPKIYEYDTLSSEERWDEKFDVIMANPPFMTPKGGIKPHKKFSVEANRAEVLFVDYIHEHLLPDGRAGIVVPEGVIFQNGRSYKQLRKMLVENSLYAVVSLPAGVFNPYSGVKTSILFLDKRLAKKTDSILFVKVNSDGYGLGAQRRLVKENDLPQVLEILNKYKKDLSEGKKPELKPLQKNLAHIVSKKDIEKQDYNLTGDRYKEEKIYNGKWDFVKLEDILEYEQPTKYLIKKEEYDKDYKIPVLTAGKSFILGYTNETEGIYDNLPVILFDDFTTDKRFVDFNFKIKSSATKLLKPKNDKINLKFVYHMMKNIDFDPSIHKRYYISEYSKKDIPLPPIEIQEKIVKEIEKYENIIEGAKKVIENYEPSFKIDSKWKNYQLKDLIYTITPKQKIKTSDFKDSGKYQVIDQSQNEVAGWTDEEKAAIKPKKPVVIFGDHTCAVKYTEKPFAQGADGIKILSTSEKVIPKFLYYYLRANPLNSQGYSRHFSKLKLKKIPVPSIEKQKEIISKLGEEEKLVSYNKKIIEIFENKIKEKIDEVWGE